MRKVKIDDHNCFMDETGKLLMCCGGNGGLCSTICAAYGEGLDFKSVNDLIGDSSPLVAKCNAFKFTIGEL